VGPVNGAEDGEASKRRKLLQDALELDKDDEEEEEKEEDKPGSSEPATGVADEGRFVSCPLQ